MPRGRLRDGLARNGAIRAQIRMLMADYKTQIEKEVGESQRSPLGALVEALHFCPRRGEVKVDRIKGCASSATWEILLNGCVPAFLYSFFSCHHQPSIRIRPRVFPRQREWLHRRVRSVWERVSCNSLLPSASEHRLISLSHQHHWGPQDLLHSSPEHRCKESVLL